MDTRNSNDLRMVRSIVVFSMIVASSFSCLDDVDDLPVGSFHIEGYVDPTLGVDVAVYRVLSRFEAISSADLMPMHDLSVSLLCAEDTLQLVSDGDGHYIFYDQSIPQCGQSFFLQVQSDEELMIIELGYIPGETLELDVVDTVISNISPSASEKTVTLGLSVRDSVNAVMVGDRLADRTARSVLGQSDDIRPYYGFGEYPGSAAVNCRIARGVADSECFRSAGSLRATLQLFDDRDTLVGLVASVDPSYIAYIDAIANNVRNWDFEGIEFFYPEPRVLPSNLEGVSGYVRMQRSIQIEYVAR